MNKAETKVILKRLRKEMLRISSIGKDGNLQSCFSSLEILWILYTDILNISSYTCEFGKDDHFVLSKGQSNLAWMVVLAEKGFLPKEELDDFCKFGSRISMQADCTKFGQFVETSSGSLGHGFPMAVGMAWAAKLKNVDEKVYALVGDGELNEGTMWEAAMFASSEMLDNLTVIIDNNHSLGAMLKNTDGLEARLKAFGFEVITVDGHDTDALKIALRQRAVDKPVAVIAETKRGYGSQTLMEDRSWFHRFPMDLELNFLFEEVDKF